MENGTTTTYIVYYECCRIVVGNIENTDLFTPPRCQTCIKWMKIRSYQVRLRSIQNISVVKLIFVFTENIKDELERATHVNEH